nr:M4 family metallopeptidase [Streptomyces mashuensis]
MISAAALVVPAAAPAGAAGPPAPGSGPQQVLPGRHTATPALVDGLHEEAGGGGSAADAALAHLAARRDRYHIADPARDLSPRQTVAAGGTETVRLQQRHRGVEVLGGQYVVRMERKGGKRTVTGTSGRYFTGLKTAVTPGADEALAVERAVEAAERRLERAGTTGPRDDAEDVPPLTGTARGLVVLPMGEGVLTRHVTVRGTHPATGEPVLQEVYVDARSGYPVLQYSGIKTFTPAGAAPATAARRGGATAAAAAAAGEEQRVTGSGVKQDGRTVELQLVRDDSGGYVMRDRTRTRGTGDDNQLSTWDARGKDVSDVSGRWPDGIKEFGSPTPGFGKDATEAGAVDAHWAAGKVHDYYRTVHGRDSLDGRGTTVNSLVGVTWFGTPYVNAFWDGTKMVYGSGDAEYRPLSAGLDVVGHEMTHGVVENSANLVYAGQSGALNEAIADYFGNAIKTDAYGIAMDSPDSGLLGETLCRTKTPRACALRDLNDGRTTSASFLGVAFGTDNGGVHLNSTIFSGALWDLRKDLGRTLADKVVYKALTEYLTPLDGFTEGRNAVLAAARALGVPATGLRAAERAFNAHGIVPDWELAMGVDSDLLLGRLNTTDSSVGAGGGWWVTAKSNDSGSEPYSVWAGRTDGTGALKLVSPNDGRYHVNPATDGRTVVWEAYGPGSVDLLARPLAGGPVKKLLSGRRGWHGLQVEGTLVSFSHTFRPGVPVQVGYLRLGETEPTWVGRHSRRDSTAFQSLRNGKLSYIQRTYSRPTGYRYSTELLDIATGRTTVLPQAGTPQYLGPTALTDRYVFWIAREGDDQARRAVRRANLDGTGMTDISKETGPDALFAGALTASDDAVTVTAYHRDWAWPAPGSQYRNDILPKLWQFSTDGSRRDRVSCNRGEQSQAAAAGGRQVVWMDATTGYTDLVTRARPAGRCT